MQNGNKRRMGADEASVFCEQITLLLAAGMPMYEGLEALAEGYRGMKDYPRMKQLSADVAASGSLHAAMRDSALFPDYMVEMTQIGEQAGKLEWAMRELSAYYRREGKVRRALKSAVTYPIVLIIMIACVIGVLVMRVLPVFRQVFRSMGIAGGAPAETFMRVGMNVGYGVLVVASLALLLALMIWILSLTRARERVMGFLLRIIPPARRLRNGIAAQRFAGIMSMMLGSGFPIEEALEAAPRIVGGGIVREKLIQVGEMTRAGRSFAESITNVGLFAPIYNRMIVVGFAAGQVDVALRKVAEVYEDEVDRDFGKLISAIEPTLVAFLAVLVGAILLSVMLPMAGVLSGMM